MSLKSEIESENIPYSQSLMAYSYGNICLEANIDSRIEK